MVVTINITLSHAPHVDTSRLGGDPVYTGGGRRGPAPPPPVPEPRPSPHTTLAQVRGRARREGRARARGGLRYRCSAAAYELRPVHTGARPGPRAHLDLISPRTSHCISTATMSANGAVGTEPRLCHVRKVSGFDGYGFNLHAEKGKPGQYIGKVDDGSPAETAGLRRGDRILEVNGHSIAGESHKQVVARIKERPDDAALLVAAPAPGDPLPDLDAPAPAPASATAAAAAAPAPASPERERAARDADSASPPPLNLHMTAAEMRAHLAAKKKFDPKKVPMDLKSKFDIVKKL